MFSGTGFFTKEGQPAMIYHGQGSGRNQIAFALDDNLEKWTKPIADRALGRLRRKAGDESLGSRLLAERTTPIMPSAAAAIPS